MNEIEKPFTPETLAKRWECSPRHIRKLTTKGTIPHFKLGELIRIPAEAVERIEQCGGRNFTGGDGTQLPA